MALDPSKFEGRVPPHDLDAEKAVLSAVMVDPGDPDQHRPSAIDQVLDLLRAEHFYSEAHRRMFEACVELHAVGQPVDSVQVASWLRERERLVQVGGMPYITLLLLAAPTVVNVRAYAQTVVDTWHVRQTILASQQIAAVGYVGYGEAREYVLSSAERLARLAEGVNTSNTTEFLRDTLKRTTKEMSAIATSKRGITGVPSGIDRFDRMTKGLHPGDLTIVAARPGVGKTSFVGGIAVSVASGDPERAIPQAAVGFFSLEMPREQIANRILFGHAMVDVGKARAPDMISPAEWTRLVDAATSLGRLPIWIDDQPSLSLLDLRAKLRFMQQDCARRVFVDERGAPLRDANGAPLTMTLGLAVVDYVQLMKGRSGAPREQEVSEISRGLKALAKDMKLPVIALSQLNRQLESRSDKAKRPQLSDLRESGALEQDADNICFIYREWMHNKDDPALETVAELIIAKQRNGPTGTVLAHFDDRFTRFSNLPDDYRDDPDARTGSR